MLSLGISNNIIYGPILIEDDKQLNGFKKYKLTIRSDWFNSYDVIIQGIQSKQWSDDVISRGITKLGNKVSFNYMENQLNNKQYSFITISGPNFDKDIESILESLSLNNYSVYKIGWTNTDTRPTLVIAVGGEKLEEDVRFDASNAAIGTEINEGGFSIDALLDAVSWLTPQFLRDDTPDVSPKFEIKEGYESQDIFTAKKALIGLGYDITWLDTIFDSTLTEALRDFNSRNNIKKENGEITGTILPETWTLLKKSVITFKSMSPGEETERIKLLHWYLSKHGFWNKALTSIYDQETATTVKLFRNFTKCGVGVVNPNMEVTDIGVWFELHKKPTLESINNAKTYISTLQTGIIIEEDINNSNIDILQNKQANIDSYIVPSSNNIINNIFGSFDGFGKTLLTGSIMALGLLFIGNAFSSKKENQ